MNKCVGDYYRYALEGLQMLIDERKVLDDFRTAQYEEMVQDAENEAEK